MVTPGPSFLRPGTIASIHRLTGRGLQTEQDLQDPQLELTFRRRDPVMGWVDVVVVWPINVALDNTQAQRAVGETRATGTVKMWAVYGPPAMQQGDRFLWQNHPCIVDLVPPPGMGVVSVAFTLLEGNA
jgi:hypothetical protein